MGICNSCNHNLCIDNATTKSASLETSESPYIIGKYQNTSKVETSVHIHQAPQSNNDNIQHVSSIVQLEQNIPLIKTNGPIMKHLRKKSSKKLSKL